MQGVASFQPSTHVAVLTYGVFDKPYGGIERFECKKNCCKKYKKEGKKRCKSCPKR